MAKPEVEFTPVSSVDFAPCNPHIEGLSEAILARDSDNDSVTRILKFEPGTDTSPQRSSDSRFLGRGLHF